MYKCTQCKLEKSEDEFSKRKGRVKPVISFCRECRRIYARNWYNNNHKKCREIARKSHWKNREKILQRHREWYQKNKDKQCIKGIEYYYENIDKQLTYSKNYNKKHKEVRALYQTDWVKNNSDHVKQRSKNWAKKNYDKIRMYYAKRQEYIRRATPPWADLEKIQQIYKQCEQKTLETGIQHEVDHIIPLTHSLICGLHVEENLQIITANENSKKSNKFNI